jgi:hemerythrin-like domain-containing protein
MINPVPIKRSQALIQFSKDHHFALLLIWKIRQGLRFNVESQRINNYITFFFLNYLEEYFQEEEELLFVHLDKNKESAKMAVKDHKVLTEIAEKIKFDPKNKSLTTDFTDQLEKHIRFEERELFNELQNTLSESELNNIAEKMETLHPDKKDDNWKDTFWVKK